MKRYFSVKKTAAVILAALTLSGCGSFNIDFSSGEGFSFNKEPVYTVICPDSGETEIYTKKVTSAEKSDNPDNYEEQPSSSQEYEEFYELPEEYDDYPAEDNTVSPDTPSEEENLFSTSFSENVENENILIFNDDDIFYTESIYDSNSTVSNSITIYSCTADVSRYSKSIVENMSVEEKAAQLILARCPSENAASVMEKYNFGGYTLYAADFADRDTDSAKKFISDIKNSSDLVPFIAVDEEGGNVVRVSKYSAYRKSPFDSVLNIYRNDGMEGIISDSKEKAVLLDLLGINLNLAPVADIAEKGDYIYDRTAGCNASDTGKVVRQIIDTSGEYGIMSCLKHFPGYGGNVDTHTGISRDSRSLESFRSNDFIPFKAGIESSYSPAVLVNHNIVECMDNSLPASLSPEVHRILRDELGFDGVIITDDLGMDGIKAYTGNISPYVVGIMAGNDMLCVSDHITAYNDLLNAIRGGTLPAETVDEHVRRIIQMKINGKIIN